ncbi:MAG: hypothetical protein HY690_05840 [Chloroflexi bacterium]|nr:hypothetical protein [Chloroflexota bacterium]
MIDLRSLVQRRQGFLFLPLVYRLAGRLEQMDWEELAEDATSSAYALHAAQRLFHLPALVSHFRIGVEAEACGADLGRDAEGDWARPRSLADPALLGTPALERPPLAQALEVTGRLSEELRGEAATIGVLSGPRTLSALFAAPPPGLAQFYATLARAYAERGAHLLLVAEDPRSAPQALSPGLSLAPLFNVASYFRLPTVLLDHAAAGPAPGFDLTLGGACGHALPLEVLEGPVEQANAWRQAGAPLLATAWEVPPRLPAEQLVAWIEALQ